MVINTTTMRFLLLFVFTSASLFIQAQDYKKVEFKLQDVLSQYPVNEAEVIILTHQGVFLRKYTNGKGLVRFDSLKHGEEIKVRIHKTRFFNQEKQFTVKEDTLVRVVMDGIPGSVSYFPMMFYTFNSSLIDSNRRDSICLDISTLNSIDGRFVILGYQDVHELPGMDSLRAFSFAQMLIECGLDTNKIAKVSAASLPAVMRTGESLYNHKSNEVIDGPVLTEENILRLRPLIDEERLRRWTRVAIIDRIDQNDLENNF